MKEFQEACDKQKAGKMSKDYYNGIPGRIQGVADNIDKDNNSWRKQLGHWVGGDR